MELTQSDCYPLHLVAFWLHYLQLYFYQLYVCGSQLNRALNTSDEMGSTQVRIKLCIYRYIKDWCYTPLILVKMYGLVNDCWSLDLNISDGSVKKFWIMISEQIHLIAIVSLIKCPQTFLLNMKLDKAGRKIRNFRLIIFLIVAAQMPSAYWEKDKMPTYMEWINNVWHIMLMHKITAIVKIREGDDNAKVEFQETWTIFWTFGPQVIIIKRK